MSFWLANTSAPYAVHHTNDPKFIFPSGVVGFPGQAPNFARPKPGERCKFVRVPAEP